MSFSYKLISHKGEKFPDGQQLLVAHLKGVTDIALKLHKSHGINEELEEVIKIICMCHDFGKASTYFQNYLEDGHGSELKNHGEISAFFTYYMLPEKYKLYGFMCVKRHHGSMDNASELLVPDKDILMKQAKDIKSNIKELEAIYGTELSDFFDKMQDSKYLNQPQKQFAKSAGRFKVEDIILVEYLWSLLLTADKTQIIRGEAYQNKHCFKEEQISSYKTLVRERLIKEKPEIHHTELFSIREQIYNEIISTINSLDIKNNHKLSVNVPTGTGKTLGVYGAAFKLAERIYNESNGTVSPSIIYTLPYTSIIDQNYDELEKIMKHNNIPQYEDMILKHHSMTELRYRTSESDEYKDYDARFCVENWQSTLITTTFVQIFNTIFKTGINSIGSRFHKLAGSIIILDEVQAVDPKYYKIIEQFFDVLCKKYNAYVILVTATKPVLLEGQELVTNNKQYFNSLDRIRIENHTNKGIYLKEFCEIVEEDIRQNDDKSYLIVLNTIKTSMETARYLRDAFEGEREVLYLSTEIYPKRRMELINMIKNDTHKKYIVVSTQLIEAGVDVDFDIVYRDFCIMDSINQTGGRANRNAIKGKGILKLYMLLNENHNDKKYCSYIYPQYLIDGTLKILRDRATIEESEIFDINKQYFDMLNSKKSDDLSNDMIEAIKKLSFESFRNMFELIKEETQKVDIIINADEISQECIEKIIEGELGEQEMINCWRRLNQYKVSINKNDWDNINDRKEKMNMNILELEYYDMDLGIKRMDEGISI